MKDIIREEKKRNEAYEIKIDELNNEIAILNEEQSNSTKEQDGEQARIQDLEEEIFRKNKKIFSLKN